MTSERPVLFSRAMVRAILEGRKTQTRRRAFSPPLLRPAIWQGIVPGDRLWVREEFRGANGYEAMLLPPSQWGNKPVWYAADGAPPERGWGFLSPRVRPARHMPRFLSRLDLVVTATRMQRLHEITEEDAMAEGCDPLLVPPDGGGAPHVEGFRALWETLHGPGAWEANPVVVALTFTVERREP